MTTTPVTAGDDPTTRSTSDLVDAYGERLESCDLPMLNLGGRQQFGGRIVTFSSAIDNLEVKSIVREPGNGQVLVLDAGGALSRAMLGDHMAETAMENGWAGIVVHGAVRDRRALADLPIGIKALGTNPRRSHKHGGGTRDHVVRFGEASFTPGHVLVSDEDGIVVLPADAK